MRGKQPKEREHYVLRMADGTLVEVTREVYCLYNGVKTLALRRNL